jgi:hypothetical protein
MVPVYFCYLGVIINTAPFLLQSVLVWTLNKMVILGTGQTGNDLCSLEPRICVTGGNSKSSCNGAGQFAPKTGTRKRASASSLKAEEARLLSRSKSSCKSGLSYAPTQPTEHMQTHTSPELTGAGHQEPQPWLRHILTLGCQMTKRPDL